MGGNEHGHDDEEPHKSCSLNPPPPIDRRKAIEYLQNNPTEFENAKRVLKNTGDVDKLSVEEFINKIIPPPPTNRNGGGGLIDCIMAWARLFSCVSGDTVASTALKRNMKEAKQMSPEESQSRRQLTQSITTLNTLLYRLSEQDILSKQEYGTAKNEFNSVAQMIKNFEMSYPGKILVLQDWSRSNTLMKIIEKNHQRQQLRQYNFTTDRQKRGSLLPQLTRAPVPPPGTTGARNRPR